MLGRPLLIRVHLCVTSDPATAAAWASDSRAHVGPMWPSCVQGALHGREEWQSCDLGLSTFRRHGQHRQRANREAGALRVVAWVRCSFRIGTVEDFLHRVRRAPCQIGYSRRREGAGVGTANNIPFGPDVVVQATYIKLHGVRRRAVL